MEPTEYDLVELAPARQGADLASAVEAAQYARVVDHEEAESASESSALESFVAFFYDCAETWEQRSATEQTAALARLGGHLEELAHLGLFVYWAVLVRSLVGDEGRSQRIPLAVLKVTRLDQPPITARLPNVIPVTPS